MITLAMILGLWITTCIQTQISSEQGYVKESYHFRADGSYEYNRHWFYDSGCTDSIKVDEESGVIEIGKELTTIFSPKAYEADFSSQRGLDQGALSIYGKSLRIARGVPNSSFRNTMLSLFSFEQQSPIPE